MFIHVQGQPVEVIEVQNLDDVVMRAQDQAYSVAPLYAYETTHHALIYILEQAEKPYFWALEVRRTGELADAGRQQWLNDLYKRRGDVDLGDVAGLRLTRRALFLCWEGGLLHRVDLQTRDIAVTKLDGEFTVEHDELFHTTRTPAGDRRMHMDAETEQWS